MLCYYSMKNTSTKIYWVGAIHLVSLASSALIATADAEDLWGGSKIFKSAKIDLDGDGQKETIKWVRLVEKTKLSTYNNGKYRLTINNQVIFDAGYLSPSSDGFYIVDIDRSDKYKELVVPTFVYPDGSGGMIYEFKNGRLGRVSSDVVERPIFVGNGTIKEHQWQGFWDATFYRKLNSNHKLVAVPQKFYEVGFQSKVIKPTPLHAYRQPNKIIFTVPVGRRVKVVKTDLKGWYQIAAGNGKFGWIKNSTQSMLGYLRGGYLVAG